MKTKVALLMLLMGFGTAAMALEPADLDNKIRLLTDKFDAFQHKPTFIPAENLRQAQGIMLLDRTKAGFLFAYQGGGGVAMVRDSGTGKWSPPAFVAANEGSLGAEQHFIVVLFMTTNSTRMLLNQNYDFGGEARGTAGNTSSGVQTSEPTTPVLVYDDRQGLYGGATVKGGGITPDNQANEVYYGQPMTVADILFNHRAQSSAAANSLAEEVQRYSHIQQPGASISQR